MLAEEGLGVGLGNGLDVSDVSVKFCATLLSIGRSVVKEIGNDKATHKLNSADTKTSKIEILGPIVFAKSIILERLLEDTLTAAALTSTRSRWCLLVKDSSTPLEKSERKLWISLLT